MSQNAASKSKGFLNCWRIAFPLLILFLLFLASYYTARADVPTYLVTGKVFLDKNYDSQFNGGDDLFQDVSVALFSDNGTPLAATTTSQSGQYTFTKIITGTYYIRFTRPVGYVFSSKDMGDDAIDSDVYPLDGKTPPFLLDTSNQAIQLDAGLNEPSLAIYIDSFDAIPVSSTDVVLKWETAQEMDSLGFNLYHTIDEGEEWQKLNTNLIMTQSPGSFLGAQYEYLDDSLRPGQNFYWLEHIRISGTEIYESASVTYQVKLYIPLVFH